MIFRIIDRQIYHHYDFEMFRNNYQQSEDSLGKISHSKSKNQVMMAAKLKEKESKWNERFHLEHIPQYSYQNQPHSQYLKHKFRLPIKGNEYRKLKRLNQASLQKNKVSNRPNPLRNEQKLKQAIKNAFNELKALWYSKKIPECHMEPRTKKFNRQNNPLKILQDIKEEYSEVSRQSSLIQKVISSINAREKCLQSIQQLKQGSSLSQSEVCKPFEDKISHLRILTIHCIECIFHWKQLFEQGLRPIKVKYLHNGEPYPKKIKSDYIEIANSSFKQFYRFQENKIDPFFLNYTHNNKKISNVSKNLIKRIRLCETMLNEDIENQPEIKKTPIIHKIKQPPKRQSFRNKSVSSNHDTLESSVWVKVLVDYPQFQDYLVNMLTKSSFKDSFFPSIEMSKYEEYSVLRYSGTEQQIALGIDKNSSQRKVIIFAIRDTMQNIEDSLQKICEYLWENDHCTEIRIPLLHYKQGENYSIDKQFQKKVKAVGFRWACVNQSNAVRMTVFCMKRPLNMVGHKNSKQKQSYPVIIQHLTSFTMAGNKKRCPNNCFASVLDLLQKVAECDEAGYQQICKNPEFSHHLNSIKRIKQYLNEEAIREKCEPEPGFSYPGMRSFNIETQQSLEKIFKNIQIATQSLKIPSIISLLNTSFKFRHITIQDGKHTKFFPNKDSQILICQSNYPIYLLQTDEENINFFIIEVNDNFSMSEIENIFNTMGEQSSFLDEFWLPTFVKSGQYIDEMGLMNTQLVSTNYKSSIASLIRKSKVRTKVIKPPFVFGMINKQLLEILEIPFYCTLVRKQDLI